MSLSLEELRAVVTELRPLLVGAVLQKVKQPSQHALLLEFFGRTGAHSVLICTRVGFVRLHTVDKARVRRSKVSGPGGFMMKLRKELTMARLDDMRVERRDRVVRFLFETGEGRMSLLFEATGHHPNVFLLDENDVILGSLGPNLSRKRELVQGLRYQWPMPSSGQSAQGFRFLDKSRTVCEQVDAFYADLWTRHQKEEVLHQLRWRLRSLIRHESRKQLRIQQDMKKAQRADEMFRNAELLKANLATLHGPPRPHFVELQDENGKTIRLNLDPRMTPAQNMQWMFKRAKALKKGQGILRQRMADSEELLQKLRQLYAEVKSEGAWTRVDELAEQAIGLGIRISRGEAEPEAPKRSEAATHKPFRVFRSIHNERILVGKTGQDNETLTFKIARDNDYWFHVVGMPGSHVVLARANKKDVDFESIRDAAILAAYFSKARDEGRAEVMYTQRRHVHRTRQGKAGAVHVRLSQTITVDLREERLQRLLNSEESKE